MTAPAPLLVPYRRSVPWDWRHTSWLCSSVVEVVAMAVVGVVGVGVWSWSGLWMWISRECSRPVRERERVPRQLAQKPRLVETVPVLMLVLMQVLLNLPIKHRQNHNNRHRRLRVLSTCTPVLPGKRWTCGPSRGISCASSPPGNPPHSSIIYPIYCIYFKVYTLSMKYNISKTSPPLCHPPDIPPLCQVW